MAENRLSRRQLSQLAMVGLAGWRTGALLRWFAALGVDVIRNQTAQALLMDANAPRSGRPANTSALHAAFQPPHFTRREDGGSC